MAELNDINQSINPSQVTRRKVGRARWHWRPSGGRSKFIIIIIIISIMLGMGIDKACLIARSFTFFISHFKQIANDYDILIQF